MSYEIVFIYQQLVNDLKKEKIKSKENTLKHAEEILIREKRKYRRELAEKTKPKKYRNYINGYVINCGGDYDTYWLKVFFPGEKWTEEEKHEFVEENWQECRPSQYDCTGQIFTWAIDCFNVPSGVVCYIREAMDV